MRRCAELAYRLGMMALVLCVIGYVTPSANRTFADCVGCFGLLAAFYGAIGIALAPREDR